ncbi:MAG: Crp/Fnr family transcriptional regulator [Clostridiales bacterium]|mgnify:CR=1|jgi:CRP-like cAMP-binding protein|nr:Crp/Fnr family transcriptional regulator [Clostridiales bacterium]
MGCKHCCDSHISCLEHVPIFAGLSQDEKLEIAEIASSRSYEKGEMIYRAGDKGGRLFVLYTGSAKLFRLTSDGKEQVLRLVNPGEFIGELSLFSSLPLTDNAQVLEATTMCVLQGEELKKLMAKYPTIAFKVMDELSRRLEKAEDRIEAISFSSVTERVAEALLEISEGKSEFSLPMTKGDLASQLGMSQETLSRKLAAFQEEGLIALKGQRKIIIKSRLGLMESI